MKDLIELGGDGLLALLHGKNGESLIPKPFERDIFLLDTHVAGTTHIEGIDEREPYLKSGDRLNLFREPDNPYDEFAILIKTMDGVKIGYMDLCQYFEHKKLKGYADFFNSSSSFCCGVI